MSNLNSKPELVIFDCDGVLVESERIFIRVLHKYISALGVKLTLNECADKFIGTNIYKVERYLRTNKILLAEGWSDEVYALAFKALEKEVESVEGVREVLIALQKNGLPFCVASNGPFAKMQLTLGKVGFLPWFENSMYSAHDLGHFKPEPELLLHAAKVESIQVEKCIVIEDSESGALGAKNAGMRCLVYSPNKLSISKDYSGATLFQRMSQLPELLGL